MRKSHQISHYAERYALCTMPNAPGKILTFFQCPTVLHTLSYCFYSLIQFYGAFYREGTITIALEYADGGSLANVLSQVGPIPEEVLAGMTFQVRAVCVSGGTVDGLTQSGLHTDLMGIGISSARKKGPS